MPKAIKEVFDSKAPQFVDSIAAITIIKAKDTLLKIFFTSVIPITIIVMVIGTSHIESKKMYKT